ncbi:metal ABC transporter substrate-binding protein [Caldisericum exile]|uniref:ABC transporter substrate binding protein n=1 Tax=Caldisericum exile (strain DSM 21853 / NBRC 104410 / AZM16c01) TaxID=511051 RepID=A0A7U6GE09_CALEA|nr:zinc ABC transporter substrate-binding protein [Caldisericum exile]BAL80668.1 ABC transporter substrate binding protein [Caldisericum exile AZM16c01]
MKKVIALILILLLGTFFTGCGISNKSSKLKVAVTIYPFYDAVKSIAGDLADVVVIVPPGSSPHTYVLTPQDIKNLEGVSVIFENNFGLEEFLSSVISSLNAKVVNVSESLKSIVDANGGNPHLWLNPEYFVVQSETIKNTFVELDPAHKDTYERNFEAYKSEILSKATELKQKLTTLKNRNVITFHDAFPYFAEYFGLNILSSVEPDPNKMPTPKQIIDIENLIKKYNVKVVFKEPQLSSDIYKSIVADTGVKVVDLNPLGDGVKIKTYIELMEYNVNVIYDALK